MALNRLCGGVSAGLRVTRVLQARQRLKLRLWHVPIVLAVNAAYAVFDAGAVFVVLISPRLRRQWLEFLIGPSGATAAQPHG